MSPRLTINVARVLVTLAGAPPGGMYGLEIGEGASIAVGSIYPTLRKLEAADWVRARREVGDPARLGRPLRTFYELTASGFNAARDARSELSWSPPQRLGLA